MPEITYVESRRQIAVLWQRAAEAEKARAWAEAIAVLRQVLAHPCAHHEVWAADVWEEIHGLHRSAGEYDAAIEAKRTAIAAGHRSLPDPETDIAECHLFAGRREEADSLFARLRDRAPDDVWLYNAAGFSYADVGEHHEAERWLREGIEVAIRTRDPEHLVTQLVAALDFSLEALGREPDRVLHERVDAFVAAWQPTDRRHARPALGDAFDDDYEERACAHCGFDPGRSHDELEERRRRAIERGLENEAPETLARLHKLPNFGSDPEPSRLPKAAPLSFAWFPASDWPEAVQRWPDLLDELPTDHQAYSRSLEARIKAMSRVLAGHQFHVSPMTVAGLEDYSAGHDLEPGSGEARSTYAAEILRTGGALRWPPGRNDPCWCGSAAKYKRCCSSVPPDPRY